MNEQVRELQRQVHYFRKRTQGEYSALYTFDDILGSSPLLRSTLEFAKRLSSLDTDILLVGESGTGKELFAHSIHNHGNPERPFVKVNCPAIPPELAESELFGYEKGAFSGALSTGKPGKFELADNGTIFLDEISSLPLSIQSKLLRVIQEREIEKLGGVRPKKITFRLIAATNADLRKLVEEGKFREDLYYRISKAVVQLPPLRERKEDIPLYVNHVLERLRKSIKAQIEISTEAMDLLMAYSWPGNVRQLMNSVEQAAFKAIVPSLDIVIVKPEHLPSEVREVKDVFYSSKRVIGKRMRTNYYGKLQFKTEIRKKEVELLMRALRKASGKKEEAARLLGMPRSTFYEKLRRYKIADKRGL
ncbi:MAG: sigma 54-interacting transcriptional regulator [Candidatus Methanomethyliaceae archaeon]